MIAAEDEVSDDTDTPREVAMIDVADGYLYIGSKAWTITSLGDVVRAPKIVEFTKNEDFPFSVGYFAKCEGWKEPIGDEDLFATESHAVEVNIRRLKERLRELRKAADSVSGSLMGMRDRQCEIARGR